MINEELMELAITALESGEHLKGQGYLHQVDGEGVSRKCCLGVLTLVALANGINASREMLPADYDNPAREIFAGRKEEILCTEVMNAYGLTDPDPVLVTASGHYRHATLWNDCGPVPDGTAPPEEDFTEIAAGFRRTYLEGK